MIIPGSFQKYSLLTTPPQRHTGRLHSRYVRLGMNVTITHWYSALPAGQSIYLWCRPWRTVPPRSKCTPGNLWWGRCMFKHSCSTGITCICPRSHNSVYQLHVKMKRRYIQCYSQRRDVRCTSLACFVSHFFPHDLYHASRLILIMFCNGCHRRGRTLIIWQWFKNTCPWYSRNPTLVSAFLLLASIVYNYRNYFFMNLNDPNCLQWDNKNLSLYELFKVNKKTDISG